MSALPPSAMTTLRVPVPIPPSPLASACGSGHPGIACRLTWDITHNAHAAGLASDFLSGPVKTVVRILFVLLLALIARAIAHRLISRLGRHAAAARGAVREDVTLTTLGARRQQRAEAMASILRNAGSVVIFGIAGITIAGDLGVNLAPVLASAGVLGIAIGFGAQSLVRDFISGIFMLLEDQYGVGDFIDAGDASGTVEAVSLRVTRLRDVNGVVWHVRNGTISRIGNQSQGWSRAVVDFPLPYTEDLGRARALMKEAAAGMWTQPRWRDVILEEPEVWGVESVYSDSVVMRLVARTVPMRHIQVARELRERVKAALDEADIGAGPAIPAAGPPGPTEGPSGAIGPRGPISPSPVSSPRAPAPRKGGRRPPGTAAPGEHRTLDGSHERDD
ncbi:MAG: mechanosensitive ion channel family protein [Actinobacteria bacterium]|nr:mechanosensitive ion channel family protein [Actinomycetota bacterium]